MRQKVFWIVLTVFLITVLAEPEDPCLTKFCRHGKKCVVNSDNSTVCECVTRCSEESDPVCSVYGMNFNNECEMHKFACQHGIVIKMGRKGKCVIGSKNVKPCLVEQLLQFHGRYLEFIMVAKERKINPNFKMGDQRIDALSEAQKADIVMWEFDSRDINKNNILDPREIEMIMDPLQPLESCVYGFLKSCDYNNDGNIERDEWRSCFPPVLADIEEVADS